MATTTLTSTFWRHRASRRARREAGRARRRDVPLESHAEVVTPELRPSPVEVLGAQDATRVPELVPIRYGRMSATPFTFLRGAAAVMAADLAAGPTTDISAQLCGDAHLSNFGMFNAPDRRLVFDVNDFDETIPGPFEWDVKRLVASVMVAAQNNGLSAKKARRATAAAAEGYRVTIEQVAEKTPLDVHYFRIEPEAFAARLDASDKRRKRAEKGFRKASRKNSVRALRKLTDIVDGRRVIVPDPPLVVPLEVRTGEQIELISDFYARYRGTLPLHRKALLDRFSIVDVAYKVVGVGSVGTRCMIVLLESSDGEPLFLQFKEAVSSVLEPYVGESAFSHAGQRVVEGQRLMQATGDIFLGWSSLEPPDGREIDFYFRQMWDGKGSAEVEDMGAGRLRDYARLCGATLALAHARSGDGSMIAGYVGGSEEETFDQAMVAFAEAYADRNEKDYTVMRAAIDDGTIEVVQDI